MRQYAMSDINISLFYPHNLHILLLQELRNSTISKKMSNNRKKISVDINGFKAIKHYIKTQE